MHKKLLGVLLFSVCLYGLAIPQTYAANFAVANEKTVELVQESLSQPLTEQLDQISMEFERRLTILEDNQALENLTQSDEKIIQLLEETFPQILDKANEVDLETLGNELQKASEELANLLLENPDFDHTPDTLQIATVVAQTFGISYALTNDLVSQEAADALFQKILGELDAYIRAF